MVTLLIFFHAPIPNGELLTLRTSQLYVDYTGNVIIALGRRQSGKRRGEDEFAIIDAGPVATVVALFLRLHQHDQLITGREPHQWRAEFDRLLSQIGVSFLQFRPYSLRRGGATFAFMQGMPLSQACDRGRWSQERTAKIYIKEAAALLNTLAVPPSLLAALSQLAAQWGFP